MFPPFGVSNPSWEGMHAFTKGSNPSLEGSDLCGEASRGSPHGVHGPAEGVDPSGFASLRPAGYSAPMTPARKPASYQDVLNAPPNTTAEVIDGELHLQPRPARRHTRSFSRLSRLLAGTLGPGNDGPAGWIVLLEPELHLAHDIVVPDLAGWRVERFDEDNEDRAFYEVAPDWCCEILSHGTHRIDRGPKARIYARENVGHLWLVDPIEQTIEAFERMADAKWKLLGVFSGQDVARMAPFEAMELQLSLLWGPPASP
jgi:Uma2 family endonuclease